MTKDSKDMVDTNSKDMVDTNSKDMVDTFLMEEVRYALERCHRERTKTAMDRPPAPQLETVRFKQEFCI